jgi:endonuclease/exonuclease/phosphatase family metal-dependent hydrolase
MGSKVNMRLNGVRSASAIWRLRPLAALVVLSGSLAGCGFGRNYVRADGPRYAGAPAVRALPVLAAPAPAADSLRVVSFNVEFARHIDGAIRLLLGDRALRTADVVLLQEMDAEGTRRIADALGMWYVYYPAIFHNRAGHDFGNAVLSRWPIVSDEKLVLPHRSRYAGTQRIATAATVRAGSTLVRVYSMHLGTPLDVGGEARRDQLRTVLADAALHPVVIMGGDLNDGGVGRVASEAGYAWPTREGPRTTTLGRWDHIFFKGPRVPDATRAGTGPETEGVSDHRPVWAVALVR